MRFQSGITALAGLLGVAGGAAAQGKGVELPPIRQLGAVTATASEKFTVDVRSMRALPDGRLYVNDPFGRRVLLFDADLQKFQIIADTLGANGNTYGRGAGLIAFRGDSTLFVDPQSLSMLVLDANGKVARVMSVPNAQDAMSFAGVLGAAQTDPQGRLVYRASPRFDFRGGPPGAGGAPRIPEMPDTAAIFRIDLATRTIDTVGYIKTQALKMNVTQDESGRTMMTSITNPLPVVDEWAMLPDGSVALIRGRDYHIDWVNADGSKTSSAKIPFEWQRLSDEDKVAFIDSVKAARERMGANAPMVATPGGGQQVVQGGGPPPGAGMGEQRVMIFAGPPGGDGGRGRGNAPAAGMQMAPAQLKFVEPSELPDYKPVFLNGFVRSDLDGNVWVRTIPTKAIAGGAVYDVINRKGELVERVQIPAGRNIVGFGANGAVYLTMREGNFSKLEKASVK